MKLKSIYIKNFQSHEETEINLDQNVNVIVGKSDVGKSAILRAIYWVLFNKPSGEAFMSDWEKDNTEVSLVFEDGTVSRIREKGFNGYNLNGEEYKGFGQIVPEEISEFVNMGDINFQSSQFDSPFMLSWTPGERGAYINKIVDLEIADRTQSNIKSAIRKDKDECSSLEGDIKNHKEELKNFDYLEEMEEKIIQLEEMESELEKIKKDSSRIFYLTKEIDWKEEKIAELSYISNFLPKINKAEKWIIELKEIQNKKDRVDSIVNRILKTKKTIDKLKDVPKLTLSLKSVDKNMSELEETQNNIDKLDYIIGRLEDASVRVSTLKFHIRDKRKEFHKLFPEKCPLCGK